MNISLPGPGSVMAVAVSVAIYSSAFSREISDLFRGILIIMAVVFLIGTYKIEQLHKSGTTNKNISTALQDEKEGNGEGKLIPYPFGFAILLVLVSTCLGILGSIFASYIYHDLLNLGLILVIVALLGVIFALSCLVHKIGLFQNKKING